MALLKVNNLSYQPEDRRIIKELSLAIETAEVHALIGTNGTGKSTLACLIMGCSGYQPSEGEIVFAGTIIDELAIHERAALGITMAWQEPAPDAPCGLAEGFSDSVHRRRLPLSGTGGHGSGAAPEDTRTEGTRPDSRTAGRIGAHGMGERDLRALSGHSSNVL
jgi:energy-coupling factor transporter ATP-binding protein EcfA2